MIKHSVLPVSQVMQSRLWAADSEAADSEAADCGQQTVQNSMVHVHSEGRVQSTHSYTSMEGIAATRVQEFAPITLLTLLTQHPRCFHLLHTSVSHILMWSV